MNTLETILGILAFAVVIAVLYVWGLKRATPKAPIWNAFCSVKVRERW